MITLDEACEIVLAARPSHYIVEIRDSPTIWYFLTSLKIQPAITPAGGCDIYVEKETGSACGYNFYASPQYEAAVEIPIPEKYIYKPEK